MKGSLCLTALFLIVSSLGTSAQASFSTGSGWLVYDTSSSQRENKLELHLNGTSLELVDAGTGAVLRSQPLADTHGVFVQGADGNVDDTLTINLDGGLVVLPGGIHFDGGVGGFDTLVVEGGKPAAHGSYAATGPDSGVVTHDDMNVFFSNLEPAVYTAPAATFAVSGTLVGEQINIINGAPITNADCPIGCQTTRVKSVTSTFEQVDFANKTTVTVNGLGGADTITLDNPVPADGLTTLIIDAGNNASDSIVVANFSLPGGTLSLKRADTISQSGPFTVGDLAVSALSGVNLTSTSNVVTRIAGRVTDSGATFAFKDNVSNLTIGTVDSLAGITTNNGPVSPIENTHPNGILTVDTPINTSNGYVTLFADNMTINDAITATIGTVYLDTEDVTRPIALGTKPGGFLGLIADDLNQITAGVVRVGDQFNDTGGLFVTAAIVAPTGGPGTWSTLDLRQDALITDGGSGTIKATNLVLRAAGSGGVISFTATDNDVTNLAGETDACSFTFTDKNALTVGTVNGVTGITTNGGILTLNTGSTLTLAQNINSGAGTTVLNPSAGGVNQTGGAATAANMLLTGVGSYYLTRSGNAVDTLAASVNGNLTFTDGVALIVGSVNGTVGIAVGNNIISLTADDMDIQKLVNAGNTVVFLQQRTAGRVISLGAETAGQLSLTDAELDLVTAGEILVIGNGSSGNISITGEITQAGSGYAALFLLTGAAVQDNHNGNDISVDGLAVQAATGIGTSGSTYGAVDLQGGTLAANNYISNGVSFTSAGDLIVGAVDEAIAGIYSQGAISILADGALLISQDVTSNAGAIDLESLGTNTTLTVNAGVGNAGVNPIKLVGDKMALAGGISAGGGGRITLKSHTAGHVVDLGSTTNLAAGTLELSATELNTIATAGVLQIGASDAGGINVSAQIPLQHAGTLDLETGGYIANSNSINADIVMLQVSPFALVLRAGTNISLDTQVSNLAFSSAGGDVVISNTGPLTIASVDGLTTSSNGGGNTILVATSPLTIAVDLTSVGLISANAGETSAAGDNLIVGASVTVRSTGAYVDLTAGDAINLLTGSTVRSDTGNVTLYIGYNDVDHHGSGNIAGTIKGSSPLVQGGTGSDWLTIDYTNGASLPDGLTFNGDLASDELTLTDSGGVGAHTYTMGAGSVVRDAAPAIAYGSVDTVTVNGGNGKDTFDVTPSANTTFYANGGPPITYPGDSYTPHFSGAQNAVLHITVPGASISGYWTFDNRNPFYFTSIEVPAPVQAPYFQYLPIISK